MIVIVDTGSGNLGSVMKIFEQLGAEALISSEPANVARAERIVLPGVGAFDSAMNKLNSEPGLVEAIWTQSKVKGIPTLGICLGAQLLLSRSEEGKMPGLGLIPGIARKLNPAPGLKIPHTGWNRVRSVRGHRILGAPEREWDFYFVHSYAAFPEEADSVLGLTSHGETFPSVIGSENIVGVQFHPEKSHDDGIDLFRNFLSL